MQVAKFWGGGGGGGKKIVHTYIKLLHTAVKLFLLSEVLLYIEKCYYV